VMKVFNKHKTLISGVVVTVIGAAQMGMPQLKTVLGEKAFAVTTFVLGLLVAGIGAYNTFKERQAAALAAEEAARGDPTDEAGA
jgi:hypothetical protein